jgi:biopolymer transport protein ExbD
MAKIKIKKKNPGSTDMTAMCDVAFLLLTFFVMTSTAKIPEALPVDSSTVQTKLPESDLATLSVGKGMVFLT